MKNLVKKLFRNNKSLKNKMIVFIVGLMLVLSLVNLGTGIITSYNGMTENIRLDLDTMRQIGDVALAEKISEMKSAAEAVASIPEMKEYSVTRRLSSMQSYINQCDCQAISLVDDKGNVYSKDQKLNGTNIAQKEYFKRAISGETVIGTTEVGSGGENATMPVCAPVPGSNWAVLLTYDGNVLSSVIQNITVGKTGNLFALDQSGAFIASKNADLVHSRQNLIEDAKTDSSKKTSAAVYSKMVSGETGVKNYVYLGKERICAYSPISGTDGWSLGVVAPLKEMISSISSTVVFMVISSVLMLAFGIIAAILLARNIANPVAEITERMERLAEGDLSSEVPISKSQDEIGILTDSFAEAAGMMKKYILDISWALTEISKGNFAISLEREFKGDFKQIKEAVLIITDSLSRTMEQIKDAADQVAGGSEQVSAGAQALSQGATEQASSIEELAATINDISEKINNNADNAVQASERADRVGSEASESNRRMQDMLKAMGDISNSSNEIGKIIKTIEDIAFQTNILALNAAVEAARAGAAGKGFAVVADEVRRLASQSASASKNTSVLIENSLKAVENGTQIADETAQALSMVVEGVKEVTAKIDNISQASNDEAQAVSQVTIGMDQISSVVQTNSATAEESAAASEELSGQSQLLKELLKQFKWHQQGDSENGDSSFDLSAEIENQTEHYISSDTTSRGFNDFSKY